MNDLKKQYKEHYELCMKIAESINKTSELINEFGKLPTTGVENIDNLYFALYKAQRKMIEIFEEEEEGER